MFVVISYDIPDNRRRSRVARILDDVATRVQYSVFEGVMEEPQLQATVARLQAVILPSEDRVRIYRLCAGCLKMARVLGEGALVNVPDVVVL